MDAVHAFVHEHPELGYEETLCSAFLRETLSSLGLKVESPLLGHPTAFRATLEGAGPRVGVVLLFDAVPAVAPNGTYLPCHACGHSVIAGAVVGLAACLAQTGPWPGELVVMGLPGDEIAAPEVTRRGGSKALTAQAGLWDDLNAALYAHPEFSNTVSQASRWMTRLRLGLSGVRRLEQRGELSGSAFWTFQELLSTLRRLEERHSQAFLMIQDAEIKGDVEAHCQIHAQAHVLVFGEDPTALKRRLAEVREEVAALVERAGLALKLDQVGPTYHGVVPNPVLSAVVYETMNALGLEVVRKPEPLPFATDFGNVSRRVPSALIGIGRAGGWKFHTPEGAREFNDEAAFQVMETTAAVLLGTVQRLWQQPERLSQARMAWEALQRRGHDAA